MALATGAWRDSRARSSRSQASSSASKGAERSARTARRSSALIPLISRSMSNRASIRFTASTASGERIAPCLPVFARLFAAAAMSARTKNLRRA